MQKIITHREEIMEPREEATREERRQRTPLGVMRKKLNLDRKTSDMLDRKGLVPRMINDINHGERIRDAIEGGYDFVSSDGDMIMGDTKTKKELNMRIKKRVGKNTDGSPMFAYLMAIRKEWYEEDQIKKEETNKMVDIAIQGGKAPGSKGLDVNPDQGSINIKNIQYEP